MGGLQQWRLVVVDLDGTLIPGTSVARHLDDRMDTGDVIEQLEPRLATGELTNRQIAEAYALSYRDVAEAQVLAALGDVPTLTDVASGVESLREKGIDALIATAGWSFGARALAQRWGFSAWCGVELEVDVASRRFTGQVQCHFEPEDKITWVRSEARRRGVGMEQVVAIGDGFSDLPLFSVVGFSVALNASPEARAAASATVAGRSFVDALAVVPGLIDQH